MVRIPTPVNIKFLISDHLIAVFHSLILIIQSLVLQSLHTSTILSSPNGQKHNVKKINRNSLRNLFLILSNFPKISTLLSSFLMLSMKVLKLLKMKFRRGKRSHGIELISI